MLVNYRPEYQHAWGCEELLRRSGSIPSPPRAPPSSSMRSSATTPTRRSVEAAPDRAHGGQPVLPRGVRSRAGRDASPRRPTGSYRLLRSLDTIEVPATVQSVLAARIDRLTPGQERAPVRPVIGTTCRFDVPRRSPACRGTSSGTASTGCRPRSSSTRPRSFPTLEYTFKHALTHEVTYGSLLRTAGARSTRGSSRPSSACTRTGSTSTSSRSPHTQCGARSPTRRSRISTRRGTRRSGVRPTTRPSPIYTQALDLLARWPAGRGAGAPGATDSPRAGAGVADDAGLRNAGGRAHLQAGIRAGRGDRPAGRALPGDVGPVDLHHDRPGQLRGGAPDRRGSDRSQRAPGRPRPPAGGPSRDVADDALGGRPGGDSPAHRGRHRPLRQGSAPIPGFPVRGSRPGSLLPHALVRGPVDARPSDAGHRTQPLRHGPRPRARPSGKHRQRLALRDHPPLSRRRQRDDERSRRIDAGDVPRARVRPVAGIRAHLRSLDRQPGGPREHRPDPPRNQRVSRVRQPCSGLRPSMGSWPVPA